MLKAMLAEVIAAMFATMFTTTTTTTALWRPSCSIYSFSATAFFWINLQTNKLIRKQMQINS